ncbi:hypothetical protein PS647_06101 [Pseudomonas fluorescens]|nr:hypothetical protein PS647_06101 [Pseudomonas fluorescens]
MQLIFSEFDIISLPNESLIISANGASKTDSKKLLNVLQELKNNNHKKYQKNFSTGWYPPKNYH